MASKPFPLIVDAHLDLAWNAIDWNRDLELPVEQIRRRAPLSLPGSAPQLRLTCDPCRRRTARW